MLILAALNHPLFVVPHPAVRDDDELQISVPTGRVRSFTVEISDDLPRRSAWFTVAVGDAVIPVDALSAHLTRRGLVGFVEEGGPARVVDILESAPLRVIAALGSYPEPATVSDLFVLPQYSGIREVRAVPPDGRVVFGRR